MSVFKTCLGALAVLTCVARAAETDGYGATNRTCCPMPPQTAEEALDLAERTYAYVAKRVPAKELAGLRRELNLDAKWLREAKNAGERRNAERAIRRRRLEVERAARRHAQRGDPAGLTPVCAGHPKVVKGEER